MKWTAGVLIVLALISFSCSKAEKKEDVAAQSAQPSAAQKEDKLFADGLKQLSEKDYEDAIQIFSQFQAQHVTSRYTVAVQYNWGLALEGQGKFQEAAEKFRYVVQLTQGKVPLQEAQALYHLALAYEALGDDSKTVGALLDTLNRRQYFQEETVVEIQARLASAYARVGNETQADSYYQKAERGLTLMRRKMEGSTESKAPDWLGKALFNMGKMPLRKLTIEDFSVGLKPLERGQIWLVQAADLDDETWAPKAAFELIQAYRDAWSVIDSVPLDSASDPLVALKDQQDKKISMSVALQEVLSKLKMQKPLDDEKQNKHVSEIFSVLAKIETDTDTLIASRPIQEGLTSESQKREGIKREGRMEPISESKESKPGPARLKKKRTKK